MKNLEMIMRPLATMAFLAFAASAGACEPASGHPAKVTPGLRQAPGVLPVGERPPVVVTLREQADLRHIDGFDRAERLEQVVRTL